ncbi:hypothetical protein B0H63DRAFT_477246 [Podospora didyma]|uniref:Rhodopsin domain-containing protein n=1 Tax=Podospora didyma TaxID=330526 RepID=A0AAE0KK18_9PEZI|nr:hypothetical protein B0H63DRAFT_477246 [Podospora didyma]
MIIPPAAMPAVIANCFFTSLAFVIVCCRINTRLFVIKNIGADDGLIAMSMLASIAFLAVFMLQVKAGLGRQITFPEVPGFLQALWATIPIYNLALILCKLSITVQCYRVLRTPKMQKFLRGYFILLVVYGLLTVIGNIFICWPIEAYWMAILGVQGTCLSKGGVTFSNAGINIATDIILIVVPIPLLWRLQIPQKQKIILMCLFGMGTFACITSIIRLQSLYMIAIAPEAEQSVKGVSIAIWSSIEINVGIICASIPALKPLAVKLFPRMLLSNLYARTKGAAYYAGRSGGKGGNRSHSGTGGSRHMAGGSGQTSGMRSGNNRTTEVIQIKQSFEMTSVPATAVDDAGRNVAAVDIEDGKTSRDGSEKNLVGSSWQDEYYKKVTISSRPREIV